MESELRGGAQHGEGFRCTTCGAPVAWDPEADALSCEHCGARLEVPREDATILERPLEAAGDAARGLGADLRVARCRSCGARVTYAGASTSESCVYCGAAVVLGQEANRNALRPESLVPLDVSRSAIEQGFRAWLRRLWLRPSALAHATLADATGIYVPFWSFDARVRSTWTARSGVRSGGGARRLGRGARVGAGGSVRWSRARGERADVYDDLLVAASRGLPEPLVARLGGFDTGGLVAYRPEYLAGWRAEEYQLDLGEAWERAQREIAERQRGRCAADVPGDEQADLVVRSAISDARWKHVLLPVWSVQYRFRGELYTVLVNGQSGLVVGQAPYSPVKVALLVLALLVGAAAIVVASGGF